MSIDSNSSAKRLNLERATNFMRQFRDPDSRELKKLSANQFMEVWSHYDRDGNGYIEGTELDGFLKEFVSSANFTDISPDMKSIILLAVVATLTVCNDAASIPNEVALGQEDVVLFQEPGQVYQKDYNLEGATARLLDDIELILFYEESVNVAGIPNTVQVRDVVYYGNSTTQINRIQVFNVPSHTFVGNYWTHALVRLTSAPGEAIRTTVRFFGHYTDWR